MKVILGSGMEAHAGKAEYLPGVEITTDRDEADYFIIRLPHTTVSQRLWMGAELIKAYTAALGQDVPTLLVVEPGAFSPGSPEFAAACQSTQDKAFVIVFRDLATLNAWVLKQLDGPTLTDD